MSGLRFSILLILVFLLTSCAAITGPLQIASFPSLTPIAKYPPDPIVYRTNLEILVSDVGRAAETAVHRASFYSGYLISSNSWYTKGRKVTSLELAVPTYNFESLRSDLMNLGQVVNESLSGQPANPPPYDNYNEYSQITLQLQPAGYFISSPVEPPDWNPKRTFERAFSVFLSIFGFLSDILIWIVVVAGPFLLIGLGIGVIIHKRRSVKDSHPDPDG
jgi:hypothetical protein